MREANIAAVIGAASLAHVIVFGNSKGGTGKSTTAMHVAAGLLNEGRKVGVIDLDAQQGTLTRYIENRRAFAETHGMALPHPNLRRIESSTQSALERARVEERERFAQVFAEFAASCDFVLIDTPGGESNLSFIGHSHADTLITPLNDSFIDLDVLARVDPDSHKVLRPSRYAAAVWETRKARARRDRGSIDWIVLRNRLTSLDAHNKRAMANALDALAARIGFRLAPGLSERVIYRELFLSGLTLLDLRAGELGNHLSMSHLAARQELRALMAALGLTRSKSGAAVPAGMTGPESELPLA